MSDLPNVAAAMGDLGISDDERTPCEIWTRVMGYHRPVSQFNPGKRQEHRDRKYFVERSGDLRSDFSI